MWISPSLFLKEPTVQLPLEPFSQALITSSKIPLTSHSRDFTRTNFKQTFGGTELEDGVK